MVQRGARAAAGEGSVAGDEPQPEGGIRRDTLRRDRQGGARLHQGGQGHFS